jgi:hypothetical protein
MKDRVTSTKEEELPSISVIEPLSVSDEVVPVIRGVTHRFQQS